MVEIVVYVWARKNPDMMFHFGMRMPYMTFFFLMLRLFSRATIFYDVAGLVLGHVYYFFEDIVPYLHGFRGARIFKAPEIVSKVCKFFSLECTRELVFEEGDFILDDNFE